MLYAEAASSAQTTTLHLPLLLRYGLHICPSRLRKSSTCSNDRPMSRTDVQLSSHHGNSSTRVQARPRYLLCLLRLLFLLHISQSSGGSGGIAQRDGCEGARLRKRLKAKNVRLFEQAEKHTTKVRPHTKWQKEPDFFTRVDRTLTNPYWCEREPESNLHLVSEGMFTKTQGIICYFDHDLLLSVDEFFTSTTGGDSTRRGALGFAFHS